MSIPVVILGATVYWPSTGEVNYGDDTTAFVELVSSALAPISGLYNTTTGNVGNLALDNDGDLTVNGAKIIAGSGSSGYSGWSGYSGFTGSQGTSGYSGINGTIGVNGTSGYSGKSGFSGYSGAIGPTGAGTSGYSGAQGASGYSGLSGALKVWTTVSTTTLATLNSQYLCDTTSGSWTFTLPASPTTGDLVVITDNNNFAVNNLIIDGNGHTFDSLAGPLTIDIGRVTVTFTYNGSTWRVVSTSGPQGLSGYSGVSGATGTSGFSGYSGVDGLSGTSGVSGYSGVDGLSGTSGFSGYSGAIGSNGTSGYSGFSGVNGTSVVLKGSVADYTFLPPLAAAGDLYVVLGAGGGYNAGDGAVSDGIGGWSNVGQIQGPQGVSGYSGYSGQIGTSGYSGVDGLSGTSGFSGYSGVDGLSGTSGFSGYSGIDGTSGFSGYSGIDGTSGFSGYSGVDGLSGTSGFSGYSGYSGVDGLSGTSGYSGVDGLSGTSGYSGVDGLSGTSGFSGYSGVGTSGYSGIEGTSGFSGYSGVGTVTSIGISGTTGIGVAGSPVTSAGDITLALGAITPTSVAPTGDLTMASSTFIKGNFTSTIPTKTTIKTSTTNGTTIVALTPDGTGTQAGFRVYNSATNGTDFKMAYIDANATRVAFGSTAGGTGLPGLPVHFIAGDGVHVILRLDIYDNILLADPFNAIATTATDGFAWIRATAGVPTGVPSQLATYPQHRAIEFDKTNEELYFYNNTAAAWKKVGGGGTVTSVNVSVANGLSVSGNPITTSGTLALGLGPQVTLGGGGTAGNVICYNPTGTQLGVSLNGNFGPTSNAGAIEVGNSSGVAKVLIVGESSGGGGLYLTNGLGNYTFNCLAGDGVSGAGAEFDVLGSNGAGGLVFNGGIYTTGTGGSMGFFNALNGYAGGLAGGNGSTVAPYFLVNNYDPTLGNGVIMQGYNNVAGSSAYISIASPSNNGNLNFNGTTTASGASAVSISTTTANANAVSIDISTSNGGTINLNAPIKMNSSTGTAGQVLTSNGSTTQTWERLAPAYEEHVATAAQTVFNTTMVTTATASNKAYLQVFANGVLQQQGATKAYTVTGANQITFATGLAVGTDVVLYGY
jgi:hypothetical protein